VGLAGKLERSREVNIHFQIGFDTAQLADEFGRKFREELLHFFNREIIDFSRMRDSSPVFMSRSLNFFSLTSSFPTKIANGIWLNSRIRGRGRLYRTR
jgi:hypothetical protein